MFDKRTAWFLVTATLIAVCQGQWIRRPTCSMYPVTGTYDSCSSALEDLSMLLQLVKSVETKGPCDKKNNGLSDEIIMKLVNALVYTATQNCGASGSSNGGGDSGGAGGGMGGGASGGLGGGAGGVLGSGVGVGLGLGLGLGLGEVLDLGLGAGVGVGVGLGGN